MMTLFKAFKSILAVHLLILAVDAAHHAPIFGHEGWIFPKYVCGHFCKHVHFQREFPPIQSFEVIHVQANVGFQAEGNRTVLSSWVQKVDLYGFDVCAARTGQSGPFQLSIEWIAYVSMKRAVLPELTGPVQDAIIKFGEFTTEKQCRIEMNEKLLTRTLMTPIRSSPEPKGADGAFLWAEKKNQATSGLCYKEAQIFSGVHSGLAVDILSFTPTENVLNVSESGKITFPKEDFFSVRNGLPLCQTVKLVKKYYRDIRPAVLITPKIAERTSEEVTIAAWSESATEKGFIVCVRSTFSVNVVVTWAAFGIVDPCMGVVCDYFGVCLPTGPFSYQCVPPTCDGYEKPVCTSEAVTYENECQFQRFIFTTRREDVHLQHNGSCYGFPFQRGNTKLTRQPMTTELACHVTTFDPKLFYRGKTIHALASVDFHTTTRDPDFVHDATAVWIESINESRLKICTLSAGRGERHNSSDVSVSWLVYQGAPDGAMGGTVSLIEDWWTGTTCKRVNLAGFDSPPLVLATLHHAIEGVRHDAASVWVEDVTASSFVLCVRELQNFDGHHRSISIDYLAFNSAPKTVFSHAGRVAFTDTGKPSVKDNYAFCKNVEFAQPYLTIPAILVTATHKTTISGNVPAICNGIISWVERITYAGFRLCMKEIKNQGYDPLSIDYAVLPVVCKEGWLPHEGYCYKAEDKCKSWEGANNTCQAAGGSLASVHDELEAYFVGVLSSTKPWIGLHRSEAGLRWSDGSSVDYEHWAVGQPNNARGRQNCVLESDLRHLFNWYDVECQKCHSYVCKHDLNECETGSHTCDENASCSNEEGSFSCRCKSGFSGDGHSCTPNECILGAHDCHEHAACIDTVEGFRCKCKPGFIGDGRHCDLSACPAGYTLYDETSHCYKLFTSPRSWQGGRKQCLLDGGDLASFKDSEEYEFVQTLINVGDVWIGLNDILHEGVFGWSDNSTVTFTNWHPNEPNNLEGVENCVHTYSGILRYGQWNDSECNELRKFVCKV